MKRKLRFFITRGQWGDGYDLKFGELGDDGSVCIATPAQMFYVKSGDPIPQEPMLHLGAYGGENAADALQSLMDELWREGIRPKDIGTAGHLSATQSHLADMRVIVANKLGVELK